METYRSLATHLTLKYDHFFDTLPASLPLSPCPTHSPSSYQVPIPAPIYFSLFFIFGGGLYLFLLVPLALRTKQLLASPLVAGLFVLPLVLVSPDSPGLQMLHLTACACVLMRMVDLYYVTPWRTGKEPTVGFEDWWVEVWKPFRTMPLTQAQLERQEARMFHKGEKQKDATEDNNDTTPTDAKPMHQKSSGKPVSPTRMQRTDPNPQHWSIYLPRWIFYTVLMDMVPFVLSFLPKEQVLSLSWFPWSLVTIAVAASIIYYISLLNYTLMIVWATVTGDLVRNTEWTLVRHYFPGFATSPAEFWRQWHHLFQYIWVDLGFKPTHYLLRKYVTSKDVVPKAVVQSLEMAVPIMGVFLMSGLMHEFMVVGMWHEQFGYMTAFFMIQGVATILSKVLQQSVGKRVQVPRLVLIAMTWAFNLTTVGLFMTPVFRNAGYNVAANHSVLLHAYNFLRANKVF
ncbi:hypothetical protein BGZ74_008709 [Mortierella antarctica]|nr:hypothetical protein BGZ74_008709 [Mortierella antarctica]